MTVEELAEELFVSLPTVRRDLAELAAKNYLVRNHGGACRLDEVASETPFLFRRGFQEREKRRLGEAAARLVQDGNCVFIDNSTTTGHLASGLAGRKNLTVVTTSLPVLVSLLEKGVTVYGTGGRLIDTQYGFGGTLAEETLRRFHFDTVFFSSTGVTPSGQIADVSEETARIGRTVLACGERAVYLASADKFGVTAAPHVIAPLAAMDLVVTDRQPAGVVLPTEKWVFP